MPSDGSCFIVSHKPWNKMYSLIWRFAWKRVQFQAPLVVSSLEFLAGCQSEVFISSVAFHQRLPSVPCHIDVSSVASGFIAAWEPRSKKDSTGNMKSHSLPNLFNLMTSHHHCLLLVRGKLFMGKESHKAINTRCGVHWGPSYRLPTILK